MANNRLRIIFSGTPEFAVPSLAILLRNNYEVAGVVTAPDHPSGRGLHLTPSAIKKFAMEHHLKIFQPEKLRDEKFLREIKKLEADLQVVVAFRMMPEALWRMPPLGTINLHASLLPHYRGAAPINHAIMNGEKVTGLTTFFLKHEVDTGNILLREPVPIDENETAGELHDKLKMAGADLLLKTVKAIESGAAHEIPQSSLVNENELLKPAPKLFKEDCRIDWNNPVEKIHNHIRGLCPYPAAFTELISPGKNIFKLKIFSSEKEFLAEKIAPGKIATDGKKYLKFSGSDGYILVRGLQAEGKKRLDIEEFLRGFHISNEWTLNIMNQSL